VETLDLLEELLLDYQGTLLLVSHDRAFINNVVTSSLVFEGHGRLNEYVGGYDDWLRQQPSCELESSGSKKATAASRKEPEAARPKKEKLSYKEKRELELLPEQIASLEAEQEALQLQMGEPGFYQQADGAAVAKATERMEQLGVELEQAYARWEALAEQEG
jgi:ATP-binding cassette subfamily F protein uup